MDGPLFAAISFGSRFNVATVARPSRVGALVFANCLQS